MKTDFLRIFVTCMAGVAFFFLGTTAQAATAHFSGRGVFYFTSTSGCPLGAADQAGVNCNRIGLDIRGADAVIDTAAHTILFSIGSESEGKVVIGDVLLQGSGVAQDGKRVPLSLHLLLRRSGKKWNPDIYIHAPMRGKFTKVRIDPYLISVHEGAATRAVLTPELAQDLFASPTLAARLAQTLVDVRPTAAGNRSANDITIALGLGRLSKSVARASFTSTVKDQADLDQTLINGTWSIEVEALSDHIPLWVIQRQLFLFGLEDSPQLQTACKRGFAEHDKLSFGARNGKGYLRFNGKEAVFEHAAASGRAFMRESFIGLILTWQYNQSVPARKQA